MKSDFHFIDDNEDIIGKIIFMLYMYFVVFTRAFEVLLSRGG